MFRNVLDRKLPFLDYKDMDLKPLQNWHFSKGVSPLFRPKLTLTLKPGKTGSEKEF